MAARTAQDRIDRAIHHASWLGAFAMFAYGAALSFDVLHSIARAAGLSPVSATPTSPWTHRPGCWSRWSTASRRSVRRSPGTCSCCGSRIAAAKTIASTPRTPASRPASRTSRQRSPTPRQPSRPATGRTASHPASWCESCSPARPRIGRCPGRTWPTVPDCRAVARTRCCGRNAPAWPPATATNPPSTQPTRRHDRAASNSRRSIAMRVRLRVLIPGARVRLRRPGRGERDL